MITFSPYSFFINTSGGENNFVLTNGELKCVNMLDYEEMTSVTLIVQASDSSPTDPRKSNQTVVIKIKDVNDNYPMFTDIKSTLNIRCVFGSFCL